jgi:hypothetical protein
MQAFQLANEAMLNEWRASLENGAVIDALLGDTLNNDLMSIVVAASAETRKAWCYP